MYFNHHTVGASQHLMYYSPFCTDTAVIGISDMPKVTQRACDRAGTQFSGLASLQHHHQPIIHSLCTSICGNVNVDKCLYSSQDRPTHCKLQDNSILLEYLWVFSHMENIVTKTQPKWSSAAERNPS